MPVTVSILKPAFLAEISYIPACRLGAEYAPLSSPSTITDVPVPEFRMTSSTLGTKAPELSVICPTMLPVMTWHSATVEQQIIPLKTQNNFCLISHPGHRDPAGQALMFPCVPQAR